MASSNGAKYVYNMAQASTSKGWGSLMRSKTYKESSRNDKMEVMESRKSVSSIMQERRASVEANKVAAFLRAKVLATDMPEFMQVRALRCARTTYEGLDIFSSKKMAYNIKKDFDKVYGQTWHCIVGSSFGSFVTHSTGCFLYFYMVKENLYILVFKTKLQTS